MAMPWPMAMHCNLKLRVVLTHAFIGLPQLQLGLLKSMCVFVVCNQSTSMYIIYIYMLSISSCRWELHNFLIFLSLLLAQQSPVNNLKWKLIAGSRVYYGNRIIVPDVTLL